MAGADLEMNQRQLPSSSRALGHRARPRSLWGNLWTVTLHPSLFYRSLPMLADTRQWLWAAVIILALVGINAVRHADLITTADSGGATTEMPTEFMPGGDITGGRGEVIGEMPSDFGGLPPEGMMPTGETTTTDSNISENLTTALVAASGVIVGWLILTVLLCEVSLFNSRGPRLGQNFQIAIWSSIPLALMAGLQMLYWGSGGEIGAPGIAGLVERVPGYPFMNLFTKSLLLSLFSRLTLFWLWSLVLVYVGGRHALAGKSWAVMIVVVAWAAVSVVTPVVTGAIQAEETLDIELIDPSTLAPEGEFPIDDGSGNPPGLNILPDGENSIPAESVDGEPIPEGSSTSGEGLLPADMQSFEGQTDATSIPAEELPAREEAAPAQTEGGDE